MVIVKKETTGRVQLCGPCLCWHCSPLLAHLTRRHSRRERREAGLLTSWGTGVLFAPITIIEVPLDFTGVCKKQEGRGEEEAWTSLQPSGTSARWGRVEVGREDGCPAGKAVDSQRGGGEWQGWWMGGVVGTQSFLEGQDEMKHLLCSCTTKVPLTLPMPPAKKLSSAMHKACNSFLSNSVFHSCFHTRCCVHPTGCMICFHSVNPLWCVC